MAARGGFKRNPGTIAQILRTVDGGKRAAAQKVLDALPPEARENASIEVYQTDREVVGVKVEAHHQAKGGHATRAAGAAGLTPG